MSRPGMTAALVGAVLALAAPNAWAGPCTSDIAAFEAAIARSKGDPLAGLTVAQSVGAQLSHEPTPASVKKTGDPPKSRVAVAIVPAKRSDVQRNRLGWTRELTPDDPLNILQPHTP